MIRAESALILTGLMPVSYFFLFSQNIESNPTISTMHKTLLFAFILALFTIQELQAQSSVVYESGGELISEQAAFNVHYYDLNLTVNPADSTVGGSVGVHFNVVHPTNVIALDLDPRLNLKEVKWIEEGYEQSLHVERSDTSKKFFVTFPETLQSGRMSAVEVHYHGVPRVGENPPWDGGMVWDRTPSGDPWVGVAVQTIGAWTWWPNKDHPTDKADSVAINLTMPDDLVVASNGRDRGVSEAEPGWKTSHWFVSNPISNYNVTLNAAPYETITDTYTSVAGEEMDIIFWILPEYREQGEWLFPQFAEQLRFLEEIVGPYPFRADKYGVAHAPYLGMEHQTLLAYGASFENDNLFGLNAGYDDLHQHELAHEWWGNLVSAWDWRDFWIHEGIGTYMQPLYAEYLKGDEAYREMMELFRNRIASQREVAPRQNMSSLEITQGGRGGDVYYKGAWFMHTLRYVIGDEYFFQVLRRFAYPSEEAEMTTTGEQVRFATTDDLLHLSEHITGMDLEWLFEVYLRQPHLPRLQMNRTGHLIELEWQVPEGVEFPMPVELLVNGEAITLVPENGRISMEVPETATVEVDPHHWILKDFARD
jgi:aminopeptidase N